jgi:phage protein D
MSDAMVQKVGAALRQVTAIRQTYEQRAKTADTQQQTQDLNNQARQEIVKAISDQGLSVPQYQQAIQMAQANPTLRQRVISAAEQSGD